jgi:hypothetical protein
MGGEILSLERRLDGRNPILERREANDFLFRQSLHRGFRKTDDRRPCF